MEQKFQEFVESKANKNKPKQDEDEFNEYLVNPRTPEPEPEPQPELQPESQPEPTEAESQPEPTEAESL